jgi:hypothetical protein
MKTAYSRKTLLRSLLLVMLIYAFAEWRLARTINGSSIFNSERKQQIREFNNFANTLITELSDKCRSGEIDTVLFDDDDVVLPYVVNTAVNLKACQFVRETAVTRFKPYDLSRCSAILITEQHLPSPFAKPSTPQSRGLVKMYEWTSDKQSFSFSVYHKPGCFFTEGRHS